MHYVNHGLSEKDLYVVLANSQLTPAPADSGTAARAHARFARNSAKMGKSFAGPAAAAEPNHWAPNEVLICVKIILSTLSPFL